MKLWSILTRLIGKRLDVAEGRIAGAEIIDRDVDAEFGQFRQIVRDGIDVMHDDALGQFEFEADRDRARFAQEPWR